MNLRPLCTANVWPTMSGMIVERRDQVLMTRFSPDAFIASHLLQQVPVDERTLLDRARHVVLRAYFFRRCTMQRSVRLLCRVL